MLYPFVDEESTDLIKLVLIGNGMLTLVYGTRGELIKFASLIKELQRQKIDFLTVDTHQQDTGELVELLKLPKPDFKLKKSPRERWSKLSSRKIIPLKMLGPYSVSGAALSLMWGAKAANSLKKIFENTGGPIVYLGNTLTVGIAVRAAQTLKKKPTLIDYEAGLRTGENSLLDFGYKVGERAADLIFIRAPELESNLNGVKGRIVCIENPVAETVKLALSVKPSIEMPKGKYILANSVRVQNKNDLKELITAMESSPLPVIYSPNPSIRILLSKMNLQLDNVRIIESLNYIDYMHMMKNSSCIITDSNGVEEECAALGKPCIVTNNFLQYSNLSNYNVFVTGCNSNEILSKIEMVRRGKLKKKKLKNTDATKKAVKEIKKFLEDVK